MTAAYFPMFINIAKKKIRIIGGGTIAARRVKTLLKFAEDITVIAPEICPELEAIVDDGKVKWIPRKYHVQYLEHADLVLAATNQKEVNRQVVRDCRKAEQEGGQILVNVADDKSLCDFYFPAVVQQDEIVVGINSGGKDPGKVSRVRKAIEKLILV